MKRFTLSLGLVLVLLISMSSFGAVPQLINFQGILKDGSGNPVANGSYSVIFTIYDAPAGGTVQWAETTSVITSSGLFTVLLGALNPVPDSAFQDTARYLGVKVGVDPEMTPRQQLVSGAYSLQVAHFIPDFGVDNTFIGRNAGNLTMTGFVNTASGANALAGNTTGYGNTASGVNALYSNTTGYGNTASGANALAGNTTGSSNTASGFSALNSNTFGYYNTASGGGALFENTTGINNTASGYKALYSNTFGYDNTASGYNALYSNTFGYRNTASGVEALWNNTGGIYNTASGWRALYNNTGNLNTANGHAALYNNTTGFDNTASGYLALDSNTTGSNNTASGAAALRGNTTGNSNTAIGYWANVSAGNLTNATAVGAGAIVDASDKIRLGNSSVTVIEGQVAYTFTSDKNQKENFRRVDGEEVLEKIRGLELSSWNFKGHDPKQFRHYGPMAQDFFAAFGDDGVGKIGTETTLNSGDVAGILMIAVQALGDENAELKIRMEQLEKKLEELQAEKPQAEAR